MISSLALVMLCRGIVRLEHLRSPGIVDHLRQWALLYIIILGSLASVIVTIHNTAGLDAITKYIMAPRSET